MPVDGKCLSACKTQCSFKDLAICMRFIVRRPGFISTVKIRGPSLYCSDFASHDEAEKSILPMSRHSGLQRLCKITRKVLAASNVYSGSA